jgi:hypothetical protein
MAIVEEREPVSLEEFRSKGFVKRLANGHNKSDAAIDFLQRRYGATPVARKCDASSVRSDTIEYTGNGVDVWTYYDGNGGGRQVYIRVADKAAYQKLKANFG